jgi:putative exosortase-associated protein (TIGR04073 family)
MLRKLGRGVANVVTCPVELLRTSEQVGRRDGYLAALTVGLLQGTWRTVLRGAVGLFEVATFYKETPNNFTPLIRPEFVLGGEGVSD